MRIAMPGYRCEKCGEHVYTLFNGRCEECYMGSPILGQLILVAWISILIIWVSCWT